MAIKDVLVHLDSGENCPARLDTAIALAEKNEAHLTGLYVTTLIHVPSYVEARIPPAIIEAQAKAHQEEAAAAEKLFRDKAGKAAISHEWRHAEGEQVEVIAGHARYADLVVVGQRHPNAIGSDLPDRLILSLGRPALVVPFAGRFKKLGERVMVAWDASRLASRAVHDALPFLKAAKKVEVLAINPKSGPGAHGQVPSADICAHLARHGVKAEAQHAYADDINAGDVLLSRIADHGCDMLVMGAYGHARWRELVLGGLTDFVLRHMTVPVLMTH